MSSNMKSSTRKLITCKQQNFTKKKKKKVNEKLQLPQTLMITNCLQLWHFLPITFYTTFHTSWQLFIPLSNQVIFTQSKTQTQVHITPHCLKDGVDFAMACQSALWSVEGASQAGKGTSTHWMLFSRLSLIFFFFLLFIFSSLAIFSFFFQALIFFKQRVYSRL